MLIVYFPVIDTYVHFLWDCGATKSIVDVFNDGKAFNLALDRCEFLLGKELLQIKTQLHQTKLSKNL